MKTLTNLSLILLALATISSTVPTLATPVAASNAKCQPTFTLSMTPASTTLSLGQNSSFVATVQSVCGLEDLTVQYVRSLSPTVTNGPSLFPPPNCYHGCNFAVLAEASHILIKTTVITKATTPAGTYTFTLNVHDETCPSNFPPGTSCSNLVLDRTVSSTVTVA